MQVDKSAVESPEVDRSAAVALKVNPPHQKLTKGLIIIPEVPLRLSNQKCQHQTRSLQKVSPPHRKLTERVAVVPKVPPPHQKCFH